MLDEVQVIEEEMRKYHCIKVNVEQDYRDIIFLSIPRKLYDKMLTNSRV